MIEADLQKIHNKNILFLEDLFAKSKFNWIDYQKPLEFSFFKSGGGTHLYLVDNTYKKFLARINYYELKNEWGVKKQEYKVLKLVESLKIAPKVYFFSDNNYINQDLTIVEFTEGENVDNFSDKNIADIAIDLLKLHKAFTFDRPGDTLPPEDELPYHCDIYNEFANGEDKKIEKYSLLTEIDKVVVTYNRINNKVGQWFNSLEIFQDAKKFSLCHADLKKENILVTKSGIKLIDWECSGVDLPETDIGRLFSGCEFTEEQQEVFLVNYYGALPDKIVLQRILAVKKVLDFFRILEDYILLKRKKWDADSMLQDLLVYEKILNIY